MDRHRQSGADEGTSRWASLRAAFLAGLLVTVPAAVTLFVLWFLISWVDQAQPTTLFGRSFPGLGILLVFGGIIGVGVVTQHWVGARAVRAYEVLLDRVPVLSGVYQGVKQVVEATLLSSADRSVRGVVLVQWPREGVWSIGFHTGDAFAVGEDGTRYVSVFLPSTPNPTTGFYFMVPEDEVVHTELSVEDTAKVLMSAGIVGGKRTVTVPPLHPPGARNRDQDLDRDASGGGGDEAVPPAAAASGADQGGGDTP